MFMAYDRLLKPWEIYGGKRPFFLKYAELIGKFIQENKLSPIESELISPTLNVAQMEEIGISPLMMVYVDPGTIGGKKFAHFHYRGEIYLLDPSQWKEFTFQVKTDMLNKLQAANVISIEQIQDISDAIDPIVY